MSSALSKTLSKVKDSTSRLVSRNDRQQPEDLGTRSSYMSEETAYTDDYRAPNKSQKFASTLSRVRGCRAAWCTNLVCVQGLTSAKYATVRSAKGIKIGLQEGTDKVTGAISNTTSKMKKGKPDSASASNARAVPVV